MLNIGILQECIAMCASGKRVTGGGHEHTPDLVSGHSQVIVFDSHPPFVNATNLHSENMWRVRVINSTGPDGVGGNIRAYAVCAD